MELVFFGSGPVAAKSLRLLSGDFSIEAIITKPKPTHHRGDFPVIEQANKLGIKTYTPRNKKELDKLFETKPTKSPLGVVIDYGIIISGSVIDYFPKGIVNSHFSLLPQWRGADPITFSILSGQKTTGVSLMLINEQLDEGKLIAKDKLNITAEQNSSDLTESLIMLSDKMLKEYLPKYAAGAIKPYEQDLSKEISYSRKLTKADGTIDWQKPAEVIEREIRAFYEWPKSRTSLPGIGDVLIRKAKVISENGKAGEFEAGSDSFKIYCGVNALAIQVLQPAGKKEMPVKAFLAGYRSRLASR